MRGGVNLMCVEGAEMKPDLLLRADEPYGPPNPGMSCAETPVSKMDLDMDTVHKLSPRPPPFPFSPPIKLQGEKENKAVATLAASQSAESNL